MTNDSSSPPIAISFQEFRDGEIVDFFANENRTFRPDGVGVDFGRNRLVGVPHFPGKRNGTAAFRASFQGDEESIDKGGASRTTVLREETVATIPLPAEILEASPDVLAATIHEPPKRKKDIRSEPSFAKPSRPLGAVMSGGAKPRQAAAVVDDPLKKLGETVTKKKTPTHGRPILVVRRETPAPSPSEPLPEKDLPDRLREIDEKLGRLIETWPRLSDRLKETITALIEVGEKSDNNVKEGALDEPSAS